MSRTVVLTFLIAVLCVSFMNAQKRLSRITLKDSTVLEGYAKFVNEGKSIEFGEEKRGKTRAYSFDEIEQVEMMKGAERKTYTYIQVINQGTVKLAEVLISGRLNLYRFSYESEGWRVSNTDFSTQNISVPGPNGSISVPIGGPVTPDMVWSRQSFKDYCVRREDEEMARYFKDTAIGASFKQMGSFYFQDCQELVTKIKKGEFKLRKLSEIVAFYNANCEKIR